MTTTAMTYADFYGRSVVTTTFHCKLTSVSVMAETEICRLTERIWEPSPALTSQCI